ncbi:MAG: hypothetical protein ACOYEG_08630 [Petrimonas sp.]|jgi:hypothetical protein
MNNNIFQFNRVGMLFRRTFQQNSKAILNTALVLSALSIFCFFLFLYFTTPDGVGVSSLLSFRGNVLIFLAGVFFIFSPFFYYYSYNHPKKGLSEVMLPASVLEKFVAMQLVCMIFAPLMALIFFGGSDALLTTLFPKYQSGYAIVHFFENMLTADTVLQAFLTLQAVFFCNMLFVRRKLLKTSASFIAVALLILIISTAVLGLLDSYGYFDGMSNSISINTGQRGLFEFYSGDHPFVTFLMILRIFMEVVMPIVFMIGSYRIMKTKRY